jgi:hypothetical protein
VEKAGKTGMKHDPHFLWWREKFFDSNEKKGKNNENNRPSCI